MLSLACSPAVSLQQLRGSGVWRFRGFGLGVWGSRFGVFEFGVPGLGSTSLGFRLDSD